MSDIYHGKVSSTTDPKNQGRARVEIFGFEDGSNTTPYCRPLRPMAGPGSGFWNPPQIGDEVLVTQTASGDWVILGYHWSGRNAPPAEAAPDHHVLKTPAGHLVDFDEGGDITIRARTSGATIIIKANGTIELNGTDGNVVTTNHICAYTGAPHPQGSTNVKAGG